MIRLNMGRLNMVRPNMVRLGKICGSIGAIALVFCGLVQAQVTKADYERAAGVMAKYRALPENIADAPSWIEDEHKLVYSKSVADGHEFVLVDAESGSKQPAFDHARLSAALNAAAHTDSTPTKLPFTRVDLVDHESAVEFRLNYVDRWRCDLSNYHCEKRPNNGRSSYHEDPNAERERNSLDATKPSPDKKWEALVENYNIVVRSPDRKQHFVLSTDGSEGNFYELNSIEWSPDSEHLVAYRVRPGYKRMIHYIESSPAAQLQPIYSDMEYTKPGDVLDLQQPELFDVAGKHEMPVSNELFPNPYELSDAVWWKDGRGFTFEYNQRGHQVYRVVEVDAKTGAARTLIDEQSQTFIDYRPLILSGTDTGKKYRHDVTDGKEIIWMSERDGWAHLYLVDGTTGQFKQQITKGDWVVRSVDYVDESKRQIWFQASGMKPGEDPYFVHAYRINFDGTGLTPLADGPGNHHLDYSKDGKFYTDLVSTIDTAPVLTLYRVEGNEKVAELERGNVDKLKAAGWHAPEVFTAKGRDGKTDIWGVVWKPAHFDPQKKYPVIENIYAGPQGNFVPKTFSARTEPLTELGFVVVQMDGMGTNNRSKAFHDVAFKNLKDAGFPDRIAWHKAYAAQHPWYDITRVGVFGTSAGGQSAMGALLFHPEFYKVAVSNSGCHDNRMDKLWWNEQWMSWPIGPQYSESSNVDNAWRLQGKLMLVVGEMDSNVDPASTFQVVDRLEKANKSFDLLFAPGENHGVRGAKGAYSQRKLEDFFVRNLLGQPTPDWNEEPAHPQAILIDGD
jgi:dipeptidyl aminopeptidase/acylaminoacyl peptidase